jgi:YggT family protein
MRTLYAVLSAAVSIWVVLIIVRAVVSWVQVSPYHPAVRLLARLTDPILVPIQRLMGGRTGPIDFSPAVAILLLYIVQRLLAFILLGS